MEEKRNEKDLFNDMLRMMELHDEHMTKVVDQIQKQETMIDSQKKEILDLKSSVKSMSTHMKTMEQNQEKLLKAQSEKMDLLLEALSKKNQEDSQKDQLILKLVEKVSQAESKKAESSTPKFEDFGHRDYYGEFAYKQPMYYRAPEMDPLMMENMRLKQEIQKIEMAEVQDNQRNGGPQTDHDELVELLKKYGQIKK
jgi:hypothetical protein